MKISIGKHFWMEKFSYKKRDKTIMLYTYGFNFSIFPEDRVSLVLSLGHFDLEFCYEF